MKKILFTILVFALAFLIVVPCYSQDTVDLILGCYKKKVGHLRFFTRNVGELRIVKSHSECNPSEIPVSWNRLGLPGPQGPEGPTGTGGISDIEWVYDNETIFELYPGGVYYQLANCSDGKVVIGGGYRGACTWTGGNNPVHTCLTIIVDGPDDFQWPYKGWTVGYWNNTNITFNNYT